MLAHVIKFENCFTLSIRTEDFCIFKDKLTFFMLTDCVICLEINEIFNIKK